MDIGGGMMGDDASEERRGSSDVRKAVFAKYVGKGRWTEVGVASGGGGGRALEYLLVILRTRMSTDSTVGKRRIGRHLSGSAIDMGWLAGLG